MSDSFVEEIFGKIIVSLKDEYLSDLNPHFMVLNFIDELRLWQQLLT